MEQSALGLKPVLGWITGKETGGGSAFPGAGEGALGTVHEHLSFFFIHLQFHKSSWGQQSIQTKGSYPRLALQLGMAP